METFPVDIDAGQVVRWLKEEFATAPDAFSVTARRASIPQQIPLRREVRLGDTEREDLTEVETVATLEIAPAHASEGWRLSIVVEDEVGPRLSDSDVAEAENAEAEQTIDLLTFENEFIRSERGNATVFAEVEDAAANARLTRVLGAVETNRHPLSAAKGPRKP